MGKKRKYTEQVGVMFEPEILKQLNEITDELDMSNSEFIRKNVEDELNRKRQKKLADKQAINNKKENELYDYFEEYFESIDPAGPYEDSWENEDQSDNLIENPFEVFSIDNFIRCSWDESGMVLIVEAKNDQTKDLKDINLNHKRELETIFPDYKIALQSYTDENKNFCKFIITIDERPKSEIIDLPLEQNKRIVEKLADAIMVYYHKFCLTR